MVAKLLKVPQMLVALGCDITHFPFLPFRKVQISWALKASDLVMVVSEDLGERVRKLGAAADKVLLAPDGVDTEIFRLRDKVECRREIGVPEDRPMILQVASLDEVKGTRYLVEAMALLKRKLHQAPLLYVIGEGSLKDDLISLANDLGVEKDIVFVGRKQHDDVSIWMGASDVFCLTSIREGRPNVIIEAIASGLPVVATKVGGVPELLNASNGLLAEPRDPKDIADKLTRCIEMEWDRRKIVDTVSHLSWERTGQIYFDNLNRMARK